eukprot:CAMPEP_0196570488 /NCGR_PEP_ID=MMETSP1081-20130531/604_1 /TAXON_ID=36882 /ORGANISM="Pyramimonas amylifera, Strain CCMP720" /LENGTH=36 /DNA_ID= /DNA_START= /DNA_END= /DNA_ORIENTATION=
MAEVVYPFDTLREDLVALSKTVAALSPLKEAIAAIF